MSVKIDLNIPSYASITFENYEDLNLIWEVLENYKDCSLSVIYDETVDVPSDTSDLQQEEVSEDIAVVDNVADTADLVYKVPKSVTFTQRFQSRINKELTDVLNAVYPDYFNIDSISFEDIEDDSENMKMLIKISAKDEQYMIALKYLDENVQYIIEDLVNYYI